MKISSTKWSQSSFAVAALFAIVALAAFLLFVSTKIATAADTAPVYGVKDLGTLGGASSSPTGINDSGQVVGHSNFRAFFFSNGKMDDLGTLGGSLSVASGINESGQVAGYSEVANGSRRAFLYSNGKMNDLGTFGGESYATGINNSGQVVGHSYTSTGTSAFLYSNGKMNDLGSLGTGSGLRDTRAQAINDSGQIVGYSELATGADHAFLYSNGTMKDLGTLGGGHSYASAINKSGQVAGNSNPTDKSLRHAFLYSNGTMKDLGTLGVNGSYYPYGMNDSGQVVGRYDPAYSSSRAFLYKNGQLQDLNDLIPDSSGITLDIATDINNADQIVARGTNTAGQTRAYLLTLDNAVPTTTATPASQPNANGFYKGNVTVTLEAADEEGGSGVKEITYKIGSERPVTVRGSMAEVEVSAEGTTTITYFTKDNAGNTEETKTLTVKIDSTKPTASITTPPNDAEYFIGDEVFADYACADEEGGSGIESCTAETIDGPVNNGDAINTGEVGNYLLTVTAKDRAGNVTTKQATYSVAVRPDERPPGEVTNIRTEAGNGYVIFGWTNPTDEDFDLLRVFRSTEGKVTDPENQENMVYEGRARSFSDTGLTNGTQYTYTFMTRDFNGNWSEGVTKTVTPDKEAATVEISDLTRTYNGTAQAPTVTTDPPGLEVDLTYTDAQGNALASPTDSGTYNVTATIDDFDYKGSKTGTFVIQKAPLTITANDATRKYGEPNPDFGASYNGFVNNEVADVLGGALSFQTAADASSGIGEYPVAPSGPTSSNYDITFVDGRLTVTKATATVTLADLTHTFNNTPKAATSTTDPDGLDVDIVYSQNGQPVASPTSVGSYDVTATVRNTSYEGQKTGILVISDGAEPDTTITSGPEGSTSNSKPTFGFGGSDDVTTVGDLQFSYRLDRGTEEGAWSDYSANASVTLGGENGLSDGRYAIHVRAKDAAGNVDGSPATRSFRVDAAKPTVAATLSAQANEAGWHKADVTVTLDATDGDDPDVDGISYSINGGERVVTRGMTVTFQVAEEGINTVSYNATDGAKNASDEQTLTIKLDKTAPAVQCDAAPTGWNKGNVEINCTASDAGSGLTDADKSFKLSTSIAGGAEEANASTNNRAVTDAAGNGATAGPVAGIKVDNKAPEVTITTPQDGAEYEVGEQVAASYGCSDTGSGPASCAGTVANGASIDTSTADNKTFEVTATDSVGNTETISVSYTVVEKPVPDTPPDTRFVSGPEGPTNDSTPTFKVTGSDTSTPTTSLLYSYRLDNGSWSRFSKATSFTLGGSHGLADGSHILRVRSRDSGGNVDASPAERRFVVDTVKPRGVVHIVEVTFRPANGLVTLALGATDHNGTGVTQMRFSNDGRSYSNWEAFSSRKQWNLKSGYGQKTVHVQYRDAAGNVVTVRDTATFVERRP